MVDRLFHQSFGFRNGGITANVLVSPESDDVPYLKRARYYFLQAVYMGLPVHSDPRLFLNMNPCQILALRAGYSVAVAAGDTHVLTLSLPSLYLELISRSQRANERVFDQLDEISQERGVVPFNRDDGSLMARLNGVLERNKGIVENYERSRPEMNRMIAARSTGVRNPNSDARSWGASNRRYFAKPIVKNLQDAYSKFCENPQFPLEMQFAEAASVNNR